HEGAEAAFLACSLLVAALIHCPLGGNVLDFMIKVAVGGVHLQSELTGSKGFIPRADLLEQILGLDERALGDFLAAPDRAEHFRSGPVAELKLPGLDGCLKSLHRQVG